MAEHRQSQFGELVEFRHGAVLVVRQSHPFTASGRTTFDALLRSRPGVFVGDLLVGDATLWSSTAGGTGSLRRFWTNLLVRRPRSGCSGPG